MITRLNGQLRKTDCRTLTELILNRIVKILKLGEIQKLPQLSLCRVDEIVPKRILSDQRQLFQHLKEM